MRQGHQHRRGRNRNNGGSRKGQNPVTRSYESNGPDMKIRGTPSHIAEKYVALARDAHANGDPVLAENYFQHAEHYNRIIMAYRDSQVHQSGDATNGSHDAPGRQRHGHLPEPVGLGDELANDEAMDGAGETTFQRNGHDQNQNTSRHRDQRANFEGGRPRNDRGGRPHRAPRAERDNASNTSRTDGGGVPEHEQPEFLRRSVRRPRRDDDSDNTAEGLTESLGTDDSGQD